MILFQLYVQKTIDQCELSDSTISQLINIQVADLHNDCHTRIDMVSLSFWVINIRNID